MTLAVDAYIEVRIRQMQPHLGHLSNVFAQHEMINYIFFDVTTRHIPRIGTADFLTLDPQTHLQGQYPGPEQLSHTPSRNDPTFQT